MKPDDDRWMDYALRLGARALGTTAENPAVGCVIVKAASVLGVGCTGPGGRPHAEVMALAMAGDAARGATAYVTLEPCSHHGKSPPCVDALVTAGISRCVVAVEDPFPQVSGSGLRRLRQAGVEVDVGCKAMEARTAHAGFFTRILKNRPYVLLKLAISADGMIAAEPGQRTAITGEIVQARVHLLRAQSDAILVGRNTAVVDDPTLDVRLPGLAHRSPQPFVLGAAPLPAHCKLAQRGVRMLPDLDLAALAAQGINRLLVEGGAKTAAAFLSAGLVDEVQLFTAPMTIGPRGVPALDGMDLTTALAAFRCMHEEMLGEDRLTVYGKG